MLECRSACRFFVFLVLLTTFIDQPFFFFRDSPPHVPIKELSTKLVISIIGNLSSTIRNFFPDLQVFPALGNHDYWPQVKQIRNLFIILSVFLTPGKAHLKNKS